MNSWNKSLNRLRNVCALLLVTSLFSTSTVGADNVDKLNNVGEESKTKDSEICIAFINSLATEKALGKLKGFDVDLQVKNGTLELTGIVATNEQLNLLLNTAKSTDGVEMIINHISIKPSKAANQPVDNSGIRRELAEARKLIRQLDERLEKLESEVSSRGTKAQAKPPQPAWPTYSNGYPDYAWPNYTSPPYPIPYGWTPLKLEWDDGHWQLFPAKEETRKLEEAPTGNRKDKE